MYRILFWGIALVLCVFGQAGMLYKLEGKNKSGFILAGANTIVISSVIANMLAVVGAYDFVKVASILLGIGVLLCLFYRRIYKDIFTGCICWRDLFLFTVSLVVILLLYSAVTIIPFGIGRDPSVYFYEGVHIAETGGIHFEADSFISENYAELENLIDVNGAGLYSAYQYGLSENPSDIVIQFLHMFPSILALGYDLAGIPGLLFINPVIAVFCAAMTFIYVKDILSNEKGAWIALLLCALNPAQIYSARITQSELLCQLIFMLSVYYFGQGWKTRNTYLITLSGVLAGLMMFNRMDMYILGVGIFVFALYFVWMRPENTRIALVYSFSYFAAGMLALWYGYTFSFPYYKDHWDLGVLSAILLCNIALAAAVLISIWIRRVFLKNKKLIDIIGFFAENKLAIGALVAGLLAAALFAYFIRPGLASGSADDAARFRANALVEFCFYTSFAALIFAIYGVYKLIRKIPADKILSYLPWAFMGMSNLLIYIYSPSIASDQVWASRRWITICIPFVLVLAAVGIAELKLYRITKYMQVALTAGLVLFFAYQSRGFLFENIGDHIWEEYQQLSQMLDDGLYFSDNKFLVTLLREVWGKKNVYRIKDTFADNIGTYLQEKEPIYIIGNVPGQIKTNEYLSVKKVADYSLYSNELERAYGKMAVNIEDVTVTADIYQIGYKHIGDYEAEESVFALEKTVPSRYRLRQFGSQNGEIKNGAMVSDGMEGFVLYGPYETLENGTYEVSADFSVEKPGVQPGPVACFEVVGSNQKLINRTYIYDDKQTRVSLPFSVKGSMSSLEYRLYVYEGTVVKVSAVELLQMSDCFVPGLDDVSTVADIKNEISLFAQDVSIAYYCGKSTEGILAKINGREDIDGYGFEHLCSLNETGEFDVLVSHVTDMEWFSLLSEYDLVDRKGDYLIFVRRDSNISVSSEAAWSKGEYVNLDILYENHNGTYSVGEYETIPAGIYELQIELAEDLTAEYADILVFQNDTLIGQMILNQGESVAAIPINLWTVLSDMSVEIRCNDNTNIVKFSTWIKQYSAYEEMYWEEYLEPLVQTVWESVGADSVVFWETSRKNQSIFINGMQIHYANLLSTIAADASSMPDVIEENDWIIIRKNAARTRRLLEAGYSAVMDNAEYALFASGRVRNNFVDGSLLSEGEYLVASYFRERYDTRRSRLGLEKGGYELIAYIDWPGETNRSLVNNCRIRLTDRDELVAEYLLSDVMEGDGASGRMELHIPLWLRKTAYDIEMEVELPLQFTGVTYAIEKIKCISDGIKFDLEDFSLREGELLGEGIRVNSDDEGMIYGPYYNLEAGTYVVQWVYETNADSGVIFDVASNLGEKILAETKIDDILLSAEKTGNTELLFEVGREDSQLEFRITVPAGQDFLLKEVYVLPQ